MSRNPVKSDRVVSLQGTASAEISLAYANTAVTLLTLPNNACAIEIRLPGRSHLKISGRQPIDPIGRSVKRLGSFHNASSNAGCLYDCEQKEDPHGMKHPEASFGNVINHRRQNIGDE